MSATEANLKANLASWVVLQNAEKFKSIFNNNKPTMKPTLTTIHTKPTLKPTIHVQPTSMPFKKPINDDKPSKNRKPTHGHDDGKPSKNRKPTNDHDDDTKSSKNHDHK